MKKMEQELKKETEKRKTLESELQFLKALDKKLAKGVFLRTVYERSFSSSSIHVSCHFINHYCCIFWLHLLACPVHAQLPKASMKMRKRMPLLLKKTEIRMLLSRASSSLFRYLQVNLERLHRMMTQLSHATRSSKIWRALSSGMMTFFWTCEFQRCIQCDQRKRVHIAGHVFLIRKYVDNWYLRCCYRLEMPDNDSAQDVRVASLNSSLGGTPVGSARTSPRTRSPVRDRPIVSGGI